MKVVGLAQRPSLEKFNGRGKKSSREKGDFGSRGPEMIEGVRTCSTEGLAVLGSPS